MFAYCGNNPIVNIDSTGMLFERTVGGGGGGLAWAGGLYSSETAKVISAGALGLTITAAIQAELRTPALKEEKIALRRRSDTKEVYDYSASLKLAQIMPRRNLPQVHHIVPVGQFSSRSFKTQQYIAEMHATLRTAGINRFLDPMNLILVSAATHAALHTDTYIAHVHSYIMAANGSKEGIYAALFFLRIEIAALDIYSMGY